MKGWQKAAVAAGAITGAGLIGFYLYRISTEKALRELFHKMGDVNRDGRINGDDLYLLSKAYGSTPGAPNWNPDCDLNGDGKVDDTDMEIAGSNFGLTFEEWRKTWRKGYQKTHRLEKFPLIKEI